VSFLGIDIGTSFLKGAVLDPEAHTLRHVHRMAFPPPLIHQAPGHCEYDPSAVVNAVGALISELAAQAPDCEGLVMCSQMHGMVLRDSRGEARSSCITWRDQRAAEPHPSGHGSYFDVLTRRLDSEEVRQLGRELDPGRPLSYLFWFAEQGKLASGLTPVSIPDFVLSALCQTDPGVELTNGAAYGALNLETLGWHERVIEKLRLASLHWPPLRNCGEVVGHLDMQGKSIPCYTPVGDYQCALLGALFGMDDLSVNIATGSQVSRLTPHLTLGAYQTRPYFEGRFLNTFTGVPAGRALDVLVGLLCELPGAEAANDAWEAITRAVENVPATDLEVDLSFFSSTRGKRGLIGNIRGDNLTAGHLFRAAFKNMADSYHDCALQLWPEATWKNLLLSGGLAVRLSALRESLQARFRTRYRLAPFNEDTLHGLMILASVFSGRAESLESLTSELRAATSQADC